MRMGHHRTPAVLITLVAGLLVLGWPSAVPGVQFVFDYSLDTAGFFADPVRRDTLDATGGAWERFVDRLAPIEPAGENHWTALLMNPQGGLASVPDLVVPENVIRVFVAARDLGPNALGLATLGAATAAGSPQWQQLVQDRAQTGPNEFGPWGGSISFSRNAPWYFGATTAGLGNDQYDFLSVAMHELGHLLGFGLANSYRNAVSPQNTFVGFRALAQGSPNNPLLSLDQDGRHWQAGTACRTGTVVAALMAPTLPPGERRLPTPLDLAALQDIGWQPALAGDANCDGRVDVLDVNALVQNFGQTGFFGWRDGDLTGDGVVDLLDVNAMRQGFGAGEGAEAASVPEPSALALLAVATILGIRLLCSR